MSSDNSVAGFISRNKTAIITTAAAGTAAVGAYLYYRQLQDAAGSDDKKGESPDGTAASKKKRKNKKARTSRLKSGRTNPLCLKYGRNHKSICRAGSDVCFGCGKPGYRVRQCPQVGLRATITVPQLSLVAQISRVPLPVPPVGNTQTTSMYLIPNRIRKVLLMWSLVYYKFNIYMFMLC